ncbi:MAG: flagellin [Motiliproteus sp.]|nr:flagellin [Motiliproteus sp.]MCW9051925.1 flagellin [Motiliproteus sp.]
MAIEFNPNVSQNIRNSLVKSAEQISSGKRINQAADDPVGLVIGSDLSRRIRTDSSSITNAINGVSLVQTAQGGLQQVSESLFQLQELAVQAGNGTLNASNRQALQNQADQLIAQIGDTLSSTRFNGISPLAQNSDIQLQIGDSDTGLVSINNVDVNQAFTDLGIDSLDISTPAKAAESINALGQAVDFVASTAAEFGASQNRLDSTINNLNNSVQLQTEARSTVEDSDIALAISELLKNRLLQQSLVALQAQANAQRGEVLQLLSA